MSKPTSQGWYWAQLDNHGWIVVRVQRRLGELCAMETGEDWTFPIDTYTAWRGPIEPPETVSEETAAKALHEIYSKACQALDSDDDMYLYSFASDAREIALKAVSNDK